jgi:shikimate kinase
MGTGKTTVGARLAARLGRPFIDTDALVETEAGASVADIFASRGEPAFRALERAAVARAAEAETPSIVACGGGAAMDPENRRVLREHGVVVWLDAPAAELAARTALAAGTRPLLEGDDATATLRRLAAERHEAYAAVADTRIDTAGRDPEAVVDAVLEAVGA